MKFFSLIIFVIFLSGCATPFDRTNIQPGQRVFGPGVSVIVPTEKPWFAVDYGTSNHIRLSQINFDDSYSLRVAVNRGPLTGMFKSGQAHLAAFIHGRDSEKVTPGRVVHHRDAWVEPRYGAVCIAYLEHSEDWRGRNNLGPALVDTIGLTCPHVGFGNVFVNAELSRRYDIDAPRIDISTYAQQVFDSLEYAGVD